MAKFSDSFTPILKGLLKSYKRLTHVELQEIAWLMHLHLSLTTILGEDEEPQNITIKTQPGFQTAIELFAENAKVDFITYEETNGTGRLNGTYNYKVFQYCRNEENKYAIVVKNHWSYYDLSLIHI